MCKYFIEIIYFIHLKYMSYKYVTLFYYNIKIKKSSLIQDYELLVNYLN